MKLSFCHKFEYSNFYIFDFCLCKPLIFQTWIILSNRIHILKYQKSTTIVCKDVEIRKSEIVTNTPFLCLKSLLVFDTQR